MRNYDWNYL
jgi:Sec7-like guanine-nucleotide exchange factor